MLRDTDAMCTNVISLTDRARCVHGAQYNVIVYIAAAVARGAWQIYYLPVATGKTPAGMEMGRRKTREKVLG